MSNRAWGALCPLCLYLFALNQPSENASSFQTLRLSGDVALSSVFVSSRHRQLWAMDELQERIPEEVHDQGGKRPSQLPLLLPHWGGLQRSGRTRCPHPQRFPLERRQRAQREAGDLQTHGALLHPLHADAGVHHAGRAALLLRRQHEAHHPRERGRHAQPHQHRVLSWPAL